MHSYGKCSESLSKINYFSKIIDDDDFYDAKKTKFTFRIYKY